MTNRIGRWMQTFTGKRVFPLDMRDGDVCIEDIAHSLAQQCRYFGHSLGYLSVAQHSVLVSHHVPAEDALWGLLHDAHEAYLGDVIRPLKGQCYYLIGDDMIHRTIIEERAQKVICRTFGMLFGEPESVERIDTGILGNEKNDQMAPPPEPWDLPEPPIPGLIITSWAPEYAEEMFLRRFHELRSAAAR